MKNGDINLNLSAGAIKKGVATFLHRFHLTLFVIFILGGLAVVVFMLNGVIVKSSEANGYAPNANSTVFDEKTIQEIENLKTTGQSNDDLDLSHGRTNPFVE